MPHMNIYSRDIKQKLNKFTRICGTIETVLKTKQDEKQLKFYKTIAIPTLTYGSETWTTKQLQRNKKVEFNPKK